ncbi:hypothetical protein CTAYLR_002666 [Chrysophaeum taylorii]|uniref:Protein Churchill n=1 Tax=Chrysophaeum taylorii TaxID=2483200 RepID=A0AAD7XHN4_9STRA|nr:hypothetical protein CTAYLR_002666 [Chrysophaeum taylorii]
MCVGCIREAFVSRGSTVLESGAFALNFAACAQCGSRDVPRSRGVKVVVEEEEEELVEETEFEHACECGHVVASHWHKYAVDAASRRWVMECCLCGRGADERATLRPSARGRSQPPPPPPVPRREDRALLSAIQVPHMLPGGIAPGESEDDEWG